ncbi:MAG TPA: PQQ-binding-like beta-propeller repeat protein [Polyangiaceae bacterium]|nr:PQQ-binding-like beta-propeller repeat protein [Polyangiaceae bacterium]
MRPSRILPLFAGAACLLGCSALETSNDRVNPAKPLWFNRPAGAMQVLFLRGLTAESRSVGEAYERGRAAIDIFRGRLFVGTSDRGLYALRAASGSTIWRFETLGAVHSEPLYDAALDVVYFGSNDGALYAVHASDGSLVWRFDTGAEIARKVVLDGETLYFANAADNLFAIDRRTARRLWQVHRTPALGMEISGHAGPAVDRGVAFFAFSDGHVGAYDARDGSERWAPVDLSAEAEQSKGGEALRYLDVDTTPVAADLGPQGHVIFVASYAGGVYALDQDHGVPVWKNERAAGITDLALWRERQHTPKPGSPLYVPGGPPVAAREILLASSGESGLWALDPASGKELWRLPIPEGGITAPVSIAGALLVGTTRYGAFLLSPLNGRPIDGIDLGSGFSQTPAAFGNRAYLLSNAGTLLGLEVRLPVVRDVDALNR